MDVASVNWEVEALKVLNGLPLAHGLQAIFVKTAIALKNRWSWKDDGGMEGKKKKT